MMEDPTLIENITYAIIFLVLVAIGTGLQLLVYLIAEWWRS